MTGDFINTNMLNLNPSCHGCYGKGWVETSDRQPHKCPVCVGSGKYNGNTLNPYPFNPAPIHPLQPSPYTPQYPTIPNFPWGGGVWISSSSGSDPNSNIVGNGSVGVLNTEDNPNGVTISSQWQANEIE